MPERLVKQVIYSILTTVVIFVAGLMVFQIIKPNPSCYDHKKNNNEEGIDCGGLCESCEIKDLLALEYNVMPAWFLQNDKYFIYSRVANMNDDWGAKEFTYTFNFIKEVNVKGKIKEEIIKTVENTSYILPKQSKYLVEMIEKPNFEYDKIILRIDDKKVVWAKPLSPDFVEANLFSVANIALKTGSGQIISEANKPAGNVNYNFSKDLKRGAQGEDVFNLQSILAQNLAIYPEGAINGIFDLPTYKAVIRLQKSIGISPQTGIVDYKTREYLNQTYGGGNQRTTSTSGFTFNTNLEFGASGSEVSELQRVLKEYPAIYPEGRLTGKFDYLLKRAIERFQTEYGLQVTGAFDTPTRTKLNSLINQSIASDNDIPPGVTAYLSFDVFNNTNVSWKEVLTIGFLCDSEQNLVALAQTSNELKAQTSQSISLSWTHQLPESIAICSGGLNVYTNTMDKENIQ